MNTINTNQLTILAIVSVFSVAGFVVTGKQTSQHSIQQTEDTLMEQRPLITVEKPDKTVIPATTRKKAKQTTTTPVETTSEISTNWEPTEIVQETYADDDVYDEFADEAAYLEHQKIKRELMSDEEQAAKEQLFALEDQLMMETDDLGQHDDIQRQLVELFAGEDEHSNQLRDLRCTQTLCRMVLELSDAAEQYAILDSLPDQINWLQKSYADVQIQTNDSRLVTVYLMRSEMKNDAGYEIAEL